MVVRLAGGRLEVFAPLDASLIAERALSFATALARMGNGTLHLIWGIPGEEARAAADATLEIITARLHGQVRLSTRVDLGRSDDLVISAARYAAFGLIVAVGGGQSSTVDRAQLFFTQSIASVLVLPDRLEQAWPTKPDPRILVPLDGTSMAEAPLTIGLPLVSLEDSEFVLLRVAVHGDV